MLTRLKVQGFKNLDPIDVQFGPFTCIAGPNGVGKSNLFDAIAFLAALADKPLAEAAASVRGTEGRVGDVRSLFRSTGGERANEMTFQVEMIVPERGTDDLGSACRASMTFLRYDLCIRHRADGTALGPLEIVFEGMEPINKTGAGQVLGFPHAPAWCDSVIRGRRTFPYIATKIDEKGSIVQIGMDREGGRGGGGPRKLFAANMPRTVLSTANNADEHPTLVLARKEMMGWTQFQLEPTALRSPDPINAPRRMGANGAHLPAVLVGLAKDAERAGYGTVQDFYQQVANRLAELFENVRTLHVDEDEKHALLTIVLTDLQRSDHAASSLSDGTLRFLALTILEMGEVGPSVLCLEEPENGIHPDRVPAMIQLLQDIAVDVERPVGSDNMMRQVIVNTHSPVVVAHVPEMSLLMADATEISNLGRSNRPLSLRGMPNTWRVDDAGSSLMPLIPYLTQPIEARSRRETERSPGRERRVMDRADIQQLRLFELRVEDAE